MLPDADRSLRGARAALGGRTKPGPPGVSRGRLPATACARGDAHPTHSVAQSDFSTASLLCSDEG